jgi:hypothetical protein
MSLLRSETTHGWLTRRVLLIGAGILIHALSSQALAQKLVVVNTCGHPGTSVWFSVWLNPQTKSIAAIQNDITFNSTNTPIGTCQIAEGVNKSLSLAYLPNGCSGTGCNGIRVIILSMSDSNALGNGVLYQCRVDIPANATPGGYAFIVSNVAASDPLANPQSVSATSGGVQVTTGSCGGGC